LRFSFVALRFDPAGELVDDFMRIAGFGVSLAILNDAALVIRGAIVGAAVLATVIVSARLCPGTFMNASRCSAFDLISLAVWGVHLEVRVFSPRARRAAALVVRGAISGASWVFGRGRARKRGFPFALYLVPPAEDGFEVALCEEDSPVESTERILL
jgi:hypothetical protein